MSLNWLDEHEHLRDARAEKFHRDQTVGPFPVA